MLLQPFVDLCKDDGQTENYIQYYIDMSKHIEQSISENKLLFATHGFCPDGGIASAMIKNTYPNVEVIPLDYHILKHDPSRKILADIQWTGIVDLEPFNNQIIDIWVDHHQSAINKIPNAKQILYNMTGFSASWQLFNLSKTDDNIKFDNHIELLAVMTKITDTAGYKRIIVPPTTQITDVTSWSFSTKKGQYGLNTKLDLSIRQFEEGTWIMQDLWAIIDNDYFKWQDITWGLAKMGYMAIKPYLSEINEMRLKRTEVIRQAIKMTSKPTQSSDMLIYIFKADEFDSFTFMRTLQSRKQKMICAITDSKEGYPISLRRNPLYLTKDEEDIIQLNLLAEQLNGGGHAGASGGFSTDLDEIITTVTTWCNERNFTTSFLDLRDC